MTASVGNIVLYILFLWIAPVFVGNAICNRLSMRGTIPRSFVMGYLSMWAVFQIITVPLILLKVSFLADVVVYSIFLIGIIVYGIVKKTYRSMTIPKVEPSAWIGIIVMLATGIYMIVQSFRLQLTNADDTRFVVKMCIRDRLWSDPEIGVEWPMPEGMTVEDLTFSEKDTKWSGIKEYKK